MKNKIRRRKCSPFPCSQVILVWELISSEFDLTGGKCVFFLCGNCGFPEWGITHCWGPRSQGKGPREWSMICRHCLSAGVRLFCPLSSVIIRNDTIKLADEQNHLFPQQAGSQIIPLFTQRTNRCSLFILIDFSLFRKWVANCRIWSTSCLPDMSADNLRNLPKCIALALRLPFWALWLSQMSNLVASQIMNYADVSSRANAIEKWVAVADICRCLHNYNGVLEITSALNRSAIYRLKKTWAKVSKQVSLSVWHSLLLRGEVGRWEPS